MLINQAIEKSQGDDRNQLVRVNKEATEVFFKDKTQKEFELAKSMRFSNYKLALSHLNQSLRMEPGNHVVLLEKARLHLSRENCSDAEKTLAELTNWNPHLKEVFLIQAQLMRCKNKWDEFEPLMEKLSVKSWPVQILQIEARQSTDKTNASFSENLDRVDQLLVEHPSLPYLYKLKQGLAGEPEKKSMEKKYKDMCENLSWPLKREYSLEPRNCAFLSK